MDNFITFQEFLNETKFGKNISKDAKWSNHGERKAKEEERWSIQAIGKNLHNKDGKQLHQGFGSDDIDRTLATVINKGKSVKGVYLVNRYFFNAFDISGKTVKGITFKNCIFRDSNMSDVKFIDCEWINPEFYECNFVGATNDGIEIDKNFYKSRKCVY